MPYPSEHACRIRQPAEFESGSFRRIQNKDLSIIIGKLKGQSSTTTQAFRYPKDQWTESRAKKHCDAQGGSFDPAATQSQNMAKDELTDVREIDYSHPDDNPIIKREG